MPKRAFPLVYVCKYCGVKTAEFPCVRTDAPATLTVCDKQTCRDQAAIAYRA